MSGIYRQSTTQFVAGRPIYQKENIQLYIYCHTVENEVDGCTWVLSPELNIEKWESVSYHIGIFNLLLYWLNLFFVYIWYKVMNFGNINGLILSWSKSSSTHPQMHRRSLHQRNQRICPHSSLRFNLRISLQYDFVDIFAHNFDVFIHNYKKIPSHKPSQAPIKTLQGKIQGMFLFFCVCVWYGNHVGKDLSFFSVILHTTSQYLPLRCTYYTDISNCVFWSENLTFSHWKPDFKPLIVPVVSTYCTWYSKKCKVW